MTDNKNEQHEQSESVDSETTQPKETLGVILKQAREAKGLSAEAIAERLHLRPAIVYDIEDDRFSEIGSSTYVRGYIKNYARIVDLPISAILAGLEAQVPTVSEHNMQSFSRKTSRQARDSRLMWVTYLIAGVLFALLLIWWVQKYSLFSGVDFSQPTVEEVAASSVPALQQTSLPENQGSQQDTDLESITYANSDESEQNQTKVSLQLGEVSAEPVDAIIQAPEPRGGGTQVDLDEANSDGLTDSPINSAPAPVTLASQADEVNETNQDAMLARLEMSVSGECWINAVDATGKVLIDGVKKAGREISVSGKAPFKLILGAPKVVSIRFNGESVDMSQFPGTRVARFNLPLVR